MVRKESLKNKGLATILGASLVLGASDSKAGSLVDGSGNPVNTGYGGVVSTSYNDVQRTPSNYDVCGATTGYRAGALADSTIGKVGGKVFDMTIAGAPRFLARGLGCAISYGKPTISVNGKQCNYDDICGGSIMGEEAINAISSGLFYNSIGVGRSGGSRSGGSGAGGSGAGGDCFSGC